MAKDKPKLVITAKGWMMEEPECLDDISGWIGELLPDHIIINKIKDKYNLSHAKAKSRVSRVWRLITAEDLVDKKVEIRKLNNAIMNIYKSACNGMGLTDCLESLAALNVSPGQKARILAKWDPYKGANLALKALEQYAKVNGLYDDLLPDMKKLQREDPMDLTPQERKLRIRRLLLDTDIKIKTEEEEETDKAEEEQLVKDLSAALEAEEAKEKNIIDVETAEPVEQNKTPKKLH